MKRSILSIAILLVSIIPPGIARASVPLIQGPQVRAVSLPFSSAGSESKLVGPAARVLLAGTVDGNPETPPARYRYLLKPALYVDQFGQEVYLSTRNEYAEYGEYLVDWFDPGWTDWLEWPSQGLPEISLAGLEFQDEQGRLVHYLLALQARDESGDVSTGQAYGYDVLNFSINSLAQPRLTVREPTLGNYWFDRNYYTREFDIAPGQPLSFSWLATAESYGEQVEWYRWGLDVADYDDPSDPGWGVPPGLTPEHHFATVTGLDSGIHVIAIECADNHGAVTRARFILSVIPIPDVPDRLPLLLVDDVRDVVSHAWPGEWGSTAHDNDVMRDARWLDLIGQVSGFDPARDVVDLEYGASFGLRQAVQYRAVIWSTRANPYSYIDDNFRVQMDWSAEQVRLPYTWLDAYQRQCGNLLLAGDGAVHNFHRTDPVGTTWLHPLIYDTTESDLYCEGTGTVARSFGQMSLPGDPYATVGTQVYPYRSLGLSLMDVVQPAAVYGTVMSCYSGPQDRKRRCAGTKSLVLDPIFANAHATGGVFPCEIMTWSVIDWLDYQEELPDIMLPYVFGARDEFYDTNITARHTPWEPQTRPDGEPMAEIMWRLRTRYDWLLEKQIAAGNEAWPDFDPVDVCGGAVFEGDPGPGSQQSTLVDGATIGFLSHATVATKPSGRADVVWGFDPTRFEPADMRRAVRWVLGQHFGLDVVVSNDPTTPPPPGITIPDGTRLHPGRPNPFNPRTVFAYELVRPGRIDLGVYDARGRRVATLAGGPHEAGGHEAIWQGRDDAGRPVSAGVYFVQLAAEDRRQVQRVMLLK